MDYLETLLKPISEENYCGENLEEDSEFQNFFFTAQGTPERFDGENTIASEPPDWRAIEKQSFVFCERTKDLKLICILAQSLLNAKGIVPFSQCLKALSVLLREQWESVYPLLDEDDSDPLERVASFSHLNDPFIVSALKGTSLAYLKGVGSITLDEIDKALSESDEATLNVSQIKGVFKEINSGEVQLLYTSIAYSLESLADINTCLIENAGHEYTVDFGKSIDVLAQLKTALETCSQVQSEADIQTQTDLQSDENEENTNDELTEAGQKSQQQTTKGEWVKKFDDIQSREDVERCLHLINQYYAKYEPSSPLPVLMKRAIKLVHKDFFAIVQDIYPDALAAVQHLGGIDPDEEDENKDDDW